MADLEKLLVDRHPFPEWAMVFELSGGVGYAGYSRRADAVAFNCWPSKGNLRIAFEVKRTRADFMREIDEPAKRKWLEDNFHQTYFVVSPGVIRHDDEVPEGWGLFAATKAGTNLRRKKAPMHREVKKLPEFLALSAIRSMSQSMLSERTKHYLFEGTSITQSDIDEKVKDALSVQQEVIDELNKKALQKYQEVNDRSHLLEGPLNALARLAGEYHYSAGKSSVTSEDVLAWSKKVRANKLHQLSRTIQNAHKVLGDLIVEMEEGLVDDV